jgi:hypothetical protein
MPPQAKVVALMHSVAACLLGCECLLICGWPVMMAANLQVHEVVLCISSGYWINDTLTRIGRGAVTGR